MALLFMDDPLIHPQPSASQDTFLPAAAHHLAADSSTSGVSSPSRLAETNLAETNLAETNLAETNLAETNLAETNLAETSLASEATPPNPSPVPPCEATPPNPPAAIPLLAVEEFKLERLVGSGGIAEVWLATHPQFHQPVALKIARSTLAHNPHVEAQFQRELQAAERLVHRGLVRHLGHGQTPSGRPFLAMEWVRGRPLSHFVHKPAPWNFLRIALIQLCEALHYIHTEGVLHQDLKPANILVDFDQRRIKVTDFGLACFERAAPEATTRHVLGTPAYMAPEQARGQLGKLGPHTDLYTVGVLLFELLCGHKPFTGDTDQEVMLKHCTERTPPPPYPRLYPGPPCDRTGCAPPPRQTPRTPLLKRPIVKQDLGGDHRRRPQRPCGLRI